MPSTPQEHSGLWARLEACLTVVHVALLDLVCEPGSGTDAVAACSALRDELEALGGRDGALPRVDLGPTPGAVGVPAAQHVVELLLAGSDDLAADDLMLLARATHVLTLCERAFAPAPW